MTTWQDWRPILYLNGILAMVLGVFMVVPGLLDMLVSDQQDETWRSFFTGSLISVIVGGLTALSTHEERMANLSMRTAFLLTTTAWLNLSFFAALPFWLADINLTFPQAYFEATSGLTTTGATVIADLNILSPGLLLWRSLLHGFGGVGVIVIAVAVLPALQVGGMQVFKTESSDTSEKIIPKARQIAGGIVNAYVLLIIICALCYHEVGMNWFDAINHAISTIANGGFSTRNESFGAFIDTAPGIEWVASIFMLLSGLPFILYAAVLRGNLKPLMRNTQVRVFLTVAFSAFALIVVSRVLISNLDVSFGLAGESLFNTLSVLTGAGFATTNYAGWNTFAIIILFFCMFLGGCAGSACGGLKSFRLRILIGEAYNQLKRTLRPHAIYITHYQGKPLTAGVGQSVGTFFILYLASFVIFALILSAYNLNFITALSSSIAALANVGPGLGPIIGPDSTYAGFSSGALFWLSAAMLLGRLELLTVLVLFLPAFWRD